MTQEGVDEVVELKVEEGLRENLEVVIERLVGLVPGLTRPSKGRIDEAMDWVKEYDPSVKKDVDGTPSTAPRYYALAPEIDVVKTIKNAFAVATSAVSPSPADQASSDYLIQPKEFLDRLTSEKRITAKPHITLVHEKNVQDELERLNASSPAISDLSTSVFTPTTNSTSPQSPSSLASPTLTSSIPSPPSMSTFATSPAPVMSSLASSPSERKTGPISVTWNRCQSIASDPSRPLYSFRLTHLVWNARVMALVVSQISPLSASSPSLPLDDEEGMHLTVGTASPDIAPVEARPLVKALKRGEFVQGMGVLALGEDGVSGKGRVKGLS